MHLQHPQDETMIPGPTPALSSLRLTILTLPRSPQDMPPMLPSTHLMPNPLSAAYHPYAQYLCYAQPLPQTPQDSTEFNELQTSAPEGGSEISDMVSSHELGIEVEILAHESNPDPPVLPESHPPSSQRPNFKSYEKEKTVERCAPTEYSGQDDIIFSGEVEIISNEQFVSNISQTIPRLKKIQNDSKIPDYVNQKIGQAMCLLQMDLSCIKVGESLPEGCQVVIEVPGKGL
ncbi:hypothetical protein O181_037411 [Austropuccinia psidii MF-1]|uniref:Uncharacterized protein n=1 Tax=Austropuccinia psidii MF-1 TaxID=1389203 RepID=A0A9Q3HAR6_9BASI|nr:hypothetical protein [Austropuccinia psidii MF-1]